MPLPYTLSMLLALLLAAAIDPHAQALLQRADALDAARDPAGAIRAWMEAVKIDPSADDLDRLLQYGTAYIRSDADLPKEKVVEPLMQSALQDYLGRHPNTLQAIERVAPMLPLADGLKLVDDYLRTDPRSIRGWQARSAVNFGHARYDESIADLQKIVEIEPKNAIRRVAIESAHYGVVQKLDDPARKREHIARGLEAGRQAMEMDPADASAPSLMGMLLREEAKIETDPERKAKLLAEADAYRARAVALYKAKRSGDGGGGAVQ